MTLSLILIIRWCGVIVVVIFVLIVDQFCCDEPVDLNGENAI